MKALITGAGGQLGRALVATLPVDAKAITLASAALDITDRQAVDRAIAVHSPDVVINAAAYTTVDKAESEPARAMAVNGDAVGFLAEAARANGARFVHVSTDFVFDGRASQPLAPQAATNPLSTYGRTKLAGEHKAGPEALIVRTAWVYADEGKNFAATMLRLMSERPEVRVVADQIGTPTYAPALASAIWGLDARRTMGVFHVTDSGVASWYDFAVAIYEEARAAGLLTQDVAIVPITTADYPTPAHRPAYSVLDTSTTRAALGTVAPHWRVNLRTMLKRKCG